MCPYIFNRQNINVKVNLQCDSKIKTPALAELAMSYIMARSSKALSLYASFKKTKNMHLSYSSTPSCYAGGLVPS